AIQVSVGRWKTCVSRRKQLGILERQYKLDFLDGIALAQLGSDFLGRIREAHQGATLKRVECQGAWLAAFPPFRRPNRSRAASRRTFVLEFRHASLVQRNGGIPQCSEPGDPRSLWLIQGERHNGFGAHTRGLRYENQHGQTRTQGKLELEHGVGTP